MKNIDGTHGCIACGHSSKFRKDIIRHIESKHLDLAIECKFCPAILKTRLNFRRHLNNRHVDRTLSPGEKREELKQFLAYHNCE